MPFPTLSLHSGSTRQPFTRKKNSKGLNGSVTTLQYGNKTVDSQLEMTFTNIADEDAYAIFQNYQKANCGFDEKTGERDYVVLSAGLYTGQMAGVYSDLRYVYG